MLNFLDDEGMMVLSFVKEATSPFDESHDWKHAVDVAKLSIKMLNRKDVLYLALLHDVCDHKYPESIPREELTNFINTNIPQYNYIDKLIDKVSFTYHKNHRDEQVPKILEVVRDADRGYEALGEKGIKRLELYSKRIGRGKEDAIQHCFDKLLKMIPEGYIVNLNKKIIDNHNVIVKYVNDYYQYPKVKYLKYYDFDI
jgi:hypothetical protein